MEPNIKFKRTIKGDFEKYGRDFTRELNRLVGGRRNWVSDVWTHGMAATKDNGLMIKRCEDGPEFYLNLADTFAAYGSLFISLISLWINIPKKEKKVGGRRYVEVSHPGLNVRIDCTDPRKAEKRLKRLLKALR